MNADTVYSPMTADEMIRVEGLKKHYTARDGSRQIKALDGVDLTIRKGEVVVIIGPSGSGKSTLWLCCSRRGLRRHFPDFCSCPPWPGGSLRIGPDR